MRDKSRIFVSVAFGTAAVLFSGVADAAAVGDVGQQAKHILNDIKDVENVMGGLAYLMGGWFGIKTAMSLKDHAENAQQTPLKRPLTQLAMAGCFFALPEFMGASIGTLFTGEKYQSAPISHSE